MKESVGIDPKACKSVPVRDADPRVEVAAHGRVQARHVHQLTGHVKVVLLDSVQAAHRPLGEGGEGRVGEGRQ